jgi:hypothetical protein
MVRLLDKFANDLNEMDEFSRKLAMKLLKHGVDKERLSKPEGLIKSCSKWLKCA